MANRSAPRSVLIITIVAMAGAIIGAGPASAEVTVSPAQATQGDPARLTFRVTEDRPGAHTTQIDLRLPEATPIAETWPMSVPDWAPRVTMRPVDQPLPGLHHGRITEVVSAITWIRATPPGKNPPPAELSISLGPMPQADRMAFTVVQTYSDGFVVNWSEVPAAGAARPERPAAVVTLLPVAVPPRQVGGDTVQDAAAPAPATEGNRLGLLDVGMATAILVGLALAGWFLFRRGVPRLPSGDA